MSIFKEIEQKPVEYLVLFFIFLAAAVIFTTFGSNHFLQRRIVYATSSAYFLWSLYHHYHRGDLNISIVIEYLVFILLAVVITASTLL
jgi:hypothetical protein